MLEELKKKKISSELILVADDVNQETKSIILNAKESISKVVYCNFRDYRCLETSVLKWLEVNL